MTRIEQIKAEIERLKGQYKNESVFRTVRTDTAKEVLDNLLSFIESREKEPIKKERKNCNGCKYCRIMKDQSGWEFHGCFGGNYKGKMTSSIDLCPLKEESLEKESKGDTTEAYMKGFCDGVEAEKENDGNSPKIKGWVARDECEDILFGKGLCIHSRKPERNGDCWSAFTILMHLSWDMFPDLKWEDEPIEVELEIHRV